MRGGMQTWGNSSALVYRLFLYTPPRGMLRRCRDFNGEARACSYWVVVISRCIAWRIRLYGVSFVEYIVLSLQTFATCLVAIVDCFWMSFSILVSICYYV